jgi:hypothetical protein
MEAIGELNLRKRRLAQDNPKNPEVRKLWKRVKALQNLVLSHTLDRICLDWQLTQLEFYDSRGALLPWCVALGGAAFYDRVIREAETREEVAET